MLSKKEVKYIQSLGHKKHRDEAGCFLAEGPKLVSEFIQLIPHHIEKIYAVEAWISQQASHINHIPVQEVSPDELDKISWLQTPNQVLCIVKQSKSEVPVITNHFCLYLDTIQDPGNFGTIVRIADWFSVQHIVCTPGCADRYNPKVVQATMASLTRVNIFYDEKMDWLQYQDVPVYAAVMDGQSIYQFPKVTSGILMIGNESKGLEGRLQQLATERLTIPKKGAAESLNAAVATGIILSHLIG